MQINNIEKMINTNLNIKTIKNPFPIWIIDNFLEQNILNKIKQDWVDTNSDIWVGTRTYINGKPNVLEKGMKNINDIKDMPSSIANIIKKFHSDEFTKRIEKITKINNLVTDGSMRWTGMRLMLENSNQLIHSDARRHPENGLRKELTCLLYLNENYIKERDEGCLEVWNDQMTKRIHEIEPLDNRFVVFFNSDKSYHGVPNVKRLRKALTFCILKDEKTETSRSFAEFVARPEDSKEIDVIGKERAKGKLK